MPNELKRRLIFSVWPNLRTESLILEGDRIRYRGLEKRFLLWHWARAEKTVHLRDVIGFHNKSVIHPLVWIMALLCLMSIAANVLEWRWWFDVDLWRLPYLWFLVPVGQLCAGLVQRWTDMPQNQAWAVVHAATFIVYLLIASILRQNLLYFDAGSRSSIAFNASRIGKAELQQFIQAFDAKWAAVKVGPARTATARPPAPTPPSATPSA